MLNLPRRSVLKPVQPLFPLHLQISFLFDVISNTLSFVFCNLLKPKANLCIVNEDHPQCNVPRKAIKACQGKGQGTLLLREWPCCPFFSTGPGSPWDWPLQLQHTDLAGGGGPHHVPFLSITFSYDFPLT